jgi:hypothetical protein
MGLEKKKRWWANDEYSQAQLRAARGWTLDDWRGMSLAAQYEAMAEFDATNTMDAWSMLPDEDKKRALNRLRVYERGQDGKTS